MGGIKQDYTKFWDDSEELLVKRNSQFNYTPPTSKEYLWDWLKMPLFTKQHDVLKLAFNHNFTKINSDKHEYVLAWGKRAGKDLSISATLNFLILWLCHCNNPQKELGIVDGEPIDIINVSFDREQAETVFFEKFIRAIKGTVNPKTGTNFYEDLGMNFKRDILKNSVMFPKNIRAFSLNSVQFKMEGKNIAFAVFDEIGVFRYDHASEIRKHIKSTAMATFPQCYKLFYISFLKSGNDYMAYLLDLAKDKDREYKRQNKVSPYYWEIASTWDIRSLDGCEHESLKNWVTNKDDFKEFYDENPQEAMLMYECKIPKFRQNAYISRADKVLSCINDERTAPLIDKDKMWLCDTELKTVEFEPWFKPYCTEKMWLLQKEYEKEMSLQAEERLRIEKQKHANAQYFIRVDLSKGAIDTAGLVLAHRYNILETIKCYIDFAIQIRPDSINEEGLKEIDLSLVLDFIIKRIKGVFKFNICSLTADTWNSALFFDICKKSNIASKALSVNKEQAAYSTLKDFIYRQDIEIYHYAPFIRELTEAIITDKNKVDHPRRSNWREKEEGIKEGSSDIIDCCAGITYVMTNDGSSSPLSYYAV